MVNNRTPPPLLPQKEVSHDVCDSHCRLHTVSVLRTNNAIGKMNAIQVVVQRDTSAVASFFQPVSGLSVSTCTTGVLICEIVQVFVGCTGFQTGPGPADTGSRLVG